MRIIIPSSLRPEIKSRLHTGYIGIENTKFRARETVYWPGIDYEITYMKTNCPTCLEFRNRQSKEPLMHHEVPKLFGLNLILIYLNSLIRTVL